MYFSCYAHILFCSLIFSMCKRIIPLFYSMCFSFIFYSIMKWNLVMFRYQKYIYLVDNYTLEECFTFYYRINNGEISVDILLKTYIQKYYLEIPSRNNIKKIVTYLKSHFLFFFHNFNCISVMKIAGISELLTL